MEKMPCCPYRVVDKGRSLTYQWISPTANVPRNIVTLAKLGLLVRETANTTHSAPARMQAATRTTDVSILKPCGLEPIARAARKPETAAASDQSAAPAEAGEGNS